jgi:hypothetical protein
MRGSLQPELAFSTHTYLVSGDLASEAQHGKQTK